MSLNQKLKVSKVKKQTKKDKMDEHLGMKHGKEAKHKQSMKSRRHEEKAMEHKKHYSKEDLKNAAKHMKMCGG